MNEQSILDVRVIQPQEKHSRIFERFDSLKTGESFILVNDHDPKPLHYQFGMERADEFGWQYLEQGPELWRVQISRVKDGSGESCCGCGGGSH